MIEKTRKVWKEIGKLLYVALVISACFGVIEIVFYFFRVGGVFK